MPGKVSLVLILILLLSNTVLFAQDDFKLYFSHERGFYNEPFSLVISTTSEEVTVKYTLDGTDPRNSNSAFTKTTPFSIFVDPANTSNHDKAPGVVIRTCVAADSLAPQYIYTNTYLFPDKIGQLSPDNQRPGPGWPIPGGLNQSVNYGMDPVVCNDPRYKDSLTAAITAIPALSIVTDLKNLFDPATGIYANASQHGIEWERPVSVELLFPWDSTGFQINAGLRIRGGFTRMSRFPKHSFRLFFRGEYGAAKLNYPLFGNEGADVFDKVDVRTAQNYAWSVEAAAGANNIMNRDVFSRDTQRDMGQAYTRSRYYHLFINGTYWGLYQTEERPEADYAATYFGGENSDYDVVKVNQELRNFEYQIEATDGTLDAWQDVYYSINKSSVDNATFFKLQGMNADGSRNPDYPVLVDYNNLIDYMIIIFFTGNKDAPVTLNNQYPNNFYAIYNRNSDKGFKFIQHDAEHALLYDDLHIDIVSRQTPVYQFIYFHPNFLHNKLKTNAEYRMLFSDRVFKHFYHSGALTSTKTIERFVSREKEIEKAIIAESARWGDTWVSKPRTKDDDWLPAINKIKNYYLPLRTAIVRDQLKNDLLYARIDPPAFSENSVEIVSPVHKIQTGSRIKLYKKQNNGGVIYYTLDGTDPRSIGGTITSSALNGAQGTEIEISKTTTIKTRLLETNVWSSINEVTLITEGNLNELKITEIHYHPLDEGEINDREFEFIELKNTGPSELNLTGLAFTKGISYTFSSGTIVKPYQFVVLASNKKQFFNRYKFEPFDEYDGQLDNNGERIVLENAFGDTLISIRYSDNEPWPQASDTAGFSLVPRDTNALGDPNDPYFWRSSLIVNGSPGMDDTWVDVEEYKDSYPKNFVLEQNYPNPFNGISNIQYKIAKTGRVELSVYDVLGRKIAELVNKVQSPGNYKIVFDSAKYGLASGIYLYRISNQDNVLVKKMVLIR